MRKTTLELVNGEVLAGYEAGNFVVYKAYRYWYIAHKSGYTLSGYFDRRRDAVTACQLADSLADWDFDEPDQADLDACRDAYVEALARYRGESLQRRVG